MHLHLKSEIKKYFGLKYFFFCSFDFLARSNFPLKCIADITVSSDRKYMQLTIIKMSKSDPKITKEVWKIWSEIKENIFWNVSLFFQLVLNQLLENSKLLDTRLAEDDFPLQNNTKKQSEADTTGNKDELPLLDIPFMLLSFLLSQVRHWFCDLILSQKIDNFRF